MSFPAGWLTSSSSKAPLRARIAFACLSAIALVAIACGGSDDKAPSAPTQAPARATTPETRTPIGVPPVPPTVAPPSGAVGGEPTAFQTADGAVTIRGNLFSAAGPKRRVLILASQTPDTEAAWQPFARELAGAGIATLTFQMPQYRDAGGQRDYALMDKDIESAVLLLESRDYPLIYVLGDSTAGTAALKLAARRKLSGVVAVAAPASFGTSGAAIYDVRPDLSKITAPKLFLASTEQNAVVQELMKSPDPKQSKLVAGPGCCGIALLNGPDGAAFKQTIRDFLLK